MKIVIDACSIILLAKASVLSKLAKWRNLLVTNEVYNEVLEGKNKKFLDALLLEKLVEENSILKRSNTSKKMIQKLTNDFGLDLGEAESIALAVEGDKAILTDNKQGRKAAKIYGLKLFGSMEVIIALYKEDKIDKNKAIEALKILKEQGWFQDYLIEEALKEVKNV